MNKKIHYLLLVVGIILSLSAAGCIQLDRPGDALLLMEFTDQGTIQVKNITSYAVAEAHQLDVNFPENEITSRAETVAKQYENAYNNKSGWYEINWNAFHLSIGRAYDLTDDEIRRYIPATTSQKTYAYHNQPSPDGIYKDVLDPEHKATA
ncbi:hypothetical protein O0S10_00465 [Methanocorpusculum sp. MG]|uniref:Uncharacterized protein n=1 Tax=Methanocorpusculum petauri TaxID=3002863 RepID=A0ABT4IDP3_9EURY|nr:hypothetical protein [Methanocorpusculum petauri]MCZ0859696.1 hypothetical protein [Methanocorpusculum petauri]